MRTNQRFALWPRQLLCCYSPWLLWNRNIMYSPRQLEAVRINTGRCDLTVSPKGLCFGRASFKTEHNEMSVWDAAAEPQSKSTDLFSLCQQNGSGQHAVLCPLVLWVVAGVVRKAALFSFHLLIPPQARHPEDLILAWDLQPHPFLKEQGEKEKGKACPAKNVPTRKQAQVWNATRIGRGSGDT